MPAWAWFLFFFLLPVGFVIILSFGAKPDIFRPYSLEVLSFDQYAKALDPAYGPTLKNTLRVGLIGTLALPGRGAPLRLLAGGPGAAEVARAAAGAGARAVLDQLPGAHHRLAADHQP